MERVKEHDEAWLERKRAWSRKLGRLRLGVEPLEVQLERYRRVTWALTVIPAVISLLFVTLFTVFGRPDIGILLVVLLLLPIAVSAWYDYFRLSRRAREYEADYRAYLAERDRILAEGDGTPASDRD